MRRNIIIGNWKMNYTNTEAESFLIMLKESIEINKTDVVVCPTFVSLSLASKILEDSNIFLGAQNVYFMEAGSYTGEVSTEMLENVGTQYCIVGHSERRKYFNEIDEDINKKIAILLEHNITPILCVGENLDAREKSIHMDVVESQLRKDLDDIDIRKLKDVIIAYEPVWAIGTSKAATPEEAEEMCSYIRYIVATMYGEEIGQNIRVLYGGSANKENTKELLQQEDIDGLLVGGASLKPEFVTMIKLADEI